AAARVPRRTRSVHPRSGNQRLSLAEGERRRAASEPRPGPAADLGRRPAYAGAQRGAQSHAGPIVRRVCRRDPRRRQPRRGHARIPGAPRRADRGVGERCARLAPPAAVGLATLDRSRVLRVRGRHQPAVMSLAGRRTAVGPLIGGGVQGSHLRAADARVAERAAPMRGRAGDQSDSHPQLSEVRTMRMIRVPRVALFTDSYYEANGVARTATALEAFAADQERPLLVVHGGTANQIVESGSVVRLELARWRSTSFNLDHDLRFDVALWRHACRVARVLRWF